MDARKLKLWIPQVTKQRVSDDGREAELGQQQLSAYESVSDRVCESAALSQILLCSTVVVGTGSCCGGTAPPPHDRARLTLQTADSDSCIPACNVTSDGEIMGNKVGFDR